MFSFAGLCADRVSSSLLSCFSLSASPRHDDTTSSQSLSPCFPFPAVRFTSQPSCFHLINTFWFTIITPPNDPDLPNAKRPIPTQPPPPFGISPSRGSWSRLNGFSLFIPCLSPLLLSLFSFSWLDRLFGHSIFVRTTLRLSQTRPKQTRSSFPHTPNPSFSLSSLGRSAFP
jgi:hypothetical protein